MLRFENSVGCGAESIHNTNALLERSVQWWFGLGEDPPDSPVTLTKQTHQTKTVHEPLEKFKEKKMGKDWVRMDRVESGDCGRKVYRCCSHVVVVCFFYFFYMGLRWILLSNHHLKIITPEFISNYSKVVALSTPHLE